MPPIRVIIADDHPVLRQGVQTFLQDSGRIEIVGEAATGQDALELVEVLQPDVLILDANLPDCDGVEIAEALHKCKAAVQVLVLSAYDDLEYVRRFTAAGVAGYLLKEEAAQMIVQVVEAVARGESGWFSHRIQMQLSELAQVQSDVTRLSTREISVLQEVIRGRTNAAIGRALSISEKTVEKHLESIYRKLGVRSRTEAAVAAVREHLI